MRSHVVLLRGINVGGRGRFPMAELRSILTDDCGFDDVATYIQSGNAVIGTDRSARPAGLAERIAAAVERRRGSSPVVVVRTAAEWQAIIDRNPYLAGGDGKLVHAGVAQRALTAARRKAAETLLADHVDGGGQDRLSVQGHVVYLHTPNGLGRSTLAEKLTRSRSVGFDAITMRNLATVAKIAGLVAEQG